MRNEVRQTIAEYEGVLRQLADPKIRKPMVYPCMKEMRKLEVAILHRIWVETGTLPTTTVMRDEAMECVRFATDEFYGGFAETVKSVEEYDEASIEELANAFAENLNPGSTLDLGKFFTFAVANLRKLEKLSKP